MRDKHHDSKNADAFADTNRSKRVHLDMRVLSYDEPDSQPQGDVPEG